MEKYRVWQLTQETARAIQPHYLPLFDRFAERHAIEPRLVGLLLAGLSFDPQPSSVAILKRRNPYTAEDYFLSGLKLAREKGFFEEIEPEAFAFTPSSRTLIQEFVEELCQAMVNADPLPLDDGLRLSALLERLVQAMLNAPPPPEPWSVGLGYKIMPPPEPPLPHTEQALSCLNAYRDDCHLAAWRPSGVSGPVLETLTFLWRGEADSLETLCQKLAFRTHPTETYAAALAELRRLGYVEGGDERPGLTAQGKCFRETVEQETDGYFFAPWSSLTEGEVDEMGGLLTRLREGLTPGSGSQG